MDSSRRAQSVIFTAARIVGTLFTIAIPIVVVRALPQRAFGEYKELLLIAETILAFGALGLPASLYYLVPRRLAASQRLYTQTALLMGAVGLAAAIALIAAAPSLGRALDAPVAAHALILGAYVALALPASLLWVIPFIDQRTRFASLALAGFDALRGALVVAAALWLRRVDAVLLAAAVAAAAQVAALAAFLAWRARSAPPAADSRWPLVRAQLAYALPLTATVLIAMARDRLHAYYVAATFSASAFAIYAVATLNLPFVNLLSQTVGEVLTLANSGSFAGDRLDEVRYLWRRATHALALVLVPVCVMVEVFALELITVLFGTEYAASVPLFRVFALLVPMSIAMTSPLLRAAGDLRFMMLADAISLVVTLAVLVGLARALGPMAAVLSLVAGVGTFAVVTSWRVARRLRLGVRQLYPWGAIAGIVALSLLSALVPWVALRHAPPLVTLLAGGAIGGLAYAALVWRVGLVPAPEREALIRVAPWLARVPAAARAGGADA